MQQPGRITSSLFTGIVMCASLSILECFAQTYPVKSIRLLVGFSAGGGADQVARLVGEKLSETLGQSLIIENRPGASGSIAAARVAASAPDGYTLLMMGASNTIIESTLQKQITYDLQRDFAPVSLVVSGPFVLAIHPSLPARSVKELIALARSRAGQLSYGADVAGVTFLAGQLFNSMAKVDIAHVPYKGGVEYAIAAVAGEVGMIFLVTPVAMAYLLSGKLKPLAVTSEKRASLLPSIPTLDQSGLPGYDYSNWNGMVSPAGVPKEIITRLNSAISGILMATEIKESFNKLGLEPQSGTPEQFAVFIDREIARNARLINLAGAKGK